MSDIRRNCSNSPDIFCYICGCFTLLKQRRNISVFVKKAYLGYFKVKLGDQDKSWAPHTVCKACVELLRQWTYGNRKGMKFGIPMVWREPKNHSDDCYFCLVKTSGFNAKNKQYIKYPSLDSAIRPVSHSDELPIPIFTDLTTLTEDDEDMALSAEIQRDITDDDFEEASSSLAPKLFNQLELNDLIRDLNLSKESAELLASRLHEKNLLQPATKITYYRNRERALLQYFSAERDFVYCNNVEGLLNAMGLINYSPNEWRLFIDSSKRSLKCVLLHNGNVYGAIPIGHSVHLKEEYGNIKIVLEMLKYDDHKWVICVDLKMVNFLLGQQSGYTKYPCFLCLWDSRAKAEHWVKEKWPQRPNINVGDHNIVNEPLVDREKIIFPPLHIKLGLMKQFVKALNKEGDCFNYICAAFPGLSFEKIKAGIFDGPQIRKLMKDLQFSNTMTGMEASAWNAFMAVVNNFLGNKKSENYKDLVEDLLINFKQLGCNMSIKVHYLNSHLDKFPENLGDVSEEQGERFHQDIKVIEERYQGRWDTHMMADYCWSLQREGLNISHSRKSYKRKFLSTEN